MSFGANLPSPNKKNLWDDPNLNSTNEEARPLTYVAGWQRTGVTWIDQPRNQRSVAQKSSKGGQTTGYKYFADMMALVCHGPVDGITHIFFDSKPVWEGSIARGNEESITITIKGKGTMLLFWGREDQSAVPLFSAYGHPPYRGQCYIWFLQLNFGLGRTAAPNVELGLYRNVQVDWLPNAPGNTPDANPAVILADLLTHPLYGMGLDPALFDQPQWQATALQLANEGLNFSPVIADATGVRQLITQICEYFYGYLRWTRGGLLQLGLLRDTPTDLSALRKLTATHLTEPPQITVAEWSTTFNRTVVVIQNRSIYWQPDYAQWPDDGNLAITNQILFQSLDRRWITNQAMANMLAMRAGKRFALPNFSGTAKARRSAVAGVEIGDWIVLDYDSSTYGFAFVLQVTTVKSSGTDTEVIEMDLLGQQVTTDPSELYDPNEVLRPLPALPAGVAALSQWRVVLLPPALAGGLTGNVVGALAIRGDGTTIFANVNDSQDNQTYHLLGVSGQFAAGGTLGAAFPATANSSVALLVNLVGPDTELPDTDPVAAVNDQVLVFLGDEILSVQDVTVVSANQVQLSCLRAQMGTVLADHAAGDQVFIIERRNLQPMLVDALDDSGGSWFKLQAGSLGDLFDLSLVAPQYLQVIPVGGAPAGPVVLGHLQADGKDSPAHLTSNQNSAPAATFSWSQAIRTALFPHGEAGVLLVSGSSSPTTGSFAVPAGALQLELRDSDMLSVFDGDDLPSSYQVRLTQTGAPTSYADCVVNCSYLPPSSPPA